MVDESNRKESMAHTVNIKSKDHETFLNAIDGLRSQGISRFIDLPQIIVCGDQSSGKSSVLEAVSGLKFPTADVLCTRYATELILRRSSEKTSTITIVPDANRTDEEKGHLKQFKFEGDVVSKLGSIITDASKAMGLDGTSKNFSSDVLRIELSGPDQPHLTLVDLPGLFHAGSKAQSDNDALAVTALVTSYMAKARSVILAVVSAKNDVANQIVTFHAKQYDPDGSRTLGIITKPDTLPKSSESERHFFELAQNRDIHYKHGWHVLKNRDWESRDCTNEERDASEKAFLSKGIWGSMPSNRKGIDTLRKRLSNVLQVQIMSELSSLIIDVEASMKECEDRLELLGASRGTIKEQQLHLHSVSNNFTNLIHNAIDGKYGEHYFEDIDSDDGYTKRIRAIITNMLEEFAERMRLSGHKYQVADVADKNSSAGKFPLMITKADRLDQIRNLVKRGRGRELSTVVKEETVTSLFREQCSPWVTLIHDSAEEIFETVKSSMMMALEASCDSSTYDGALVSIINPALSELRIGFDDAVEDILSPYTKGHPQTFNHYLSENLQKVRNKHQREYLAEKLKIYFGRDPLAPSPITGSTSVNLLNLLNHLCKEENEADMTTFACSEALQIMEAYYKVALKQFVDDYGKFAVEKELLMKLPNLFTPGIVIGLDDELLEAIAGETEESKFERAQTEQKLVALEQALTTLKKLDRGDPKSMYQPFHVLINEVQKLTLPDRNEKDLNVSSHGILCSREPKPSSEVSEDSFILPSASTTDMPLSNPVQASKKAQNFNPKRKCLALHGAVPKDIETSFDEVLQARLRSPSTVDELLFWHADFDTVTKSVYNPRTLAAAALEPRGLDMLHRTYHLNRRLSQLQTMYKDAPTSYNKVMKILDIKGQVFRNMYPHCTGLADCDECGSCSTCSSG